MFGKTANCLSLLLCLAAASGFADPEAANSATNLAARVDAMYRQQSESNKNNPDRLVLPGLVADRKAGRVSLYARATGMGTDDIPEFYIIALNSGHDYEALTVAFAKPSDIHRALTFIGMQAGHPVNSDELRFWPKGERVIASVRALPPGPAYGPVRFEQLVTDENSGGPWFENGLVFVGSKYVDSPEKAGTKVYAADLFGPNAIASNYNEPTTVLDVPRQAVQSAVYGRQKMNTQFMMPRNSLLEIILEPEHRDGSKRVVDLDLTARLKPEAADPEMSDVVFDLATAGAGKDPLLKSATLNQLLEKFVELVAAGRDPFVTPRFDQALPLGLVHELCGIFNSIETERGIRVEPPPQGQLYYKAFIPNEEHRDREKRISQPWELHLARKDGKLEANLVYIEQVWKSDSIQPDLKLTERVVTTPVALRKGLDEMGVSMPVILVYSPPDVTHGELMSLVSLARATHPMIHVFLEGASSPTELPVQLTQ